MTKEEIIREAYGIRFEIVKDYVDENGRLPIYRVKLLGNLPESFEVLDHIYVRPKSLQGIDNNNGWISVSEADLPKESNKMWIVFNGMIVDCFYNSSDKVFWNTYSNKPFIDVTHYQPIVKPLNPIF